jgi:hypothetical protein
MDDFVALATTAGFPMALVLDYLDQLGHGRWQSVTEPTLAGLSEYAQDMESLHGAQVRWDMGQRKDSTVGLF